MFPFKYEGRHKVDILKQKSRSSGSFKPSGTIH